MYCWNKHHRKKFNNQGNIQWHSVLSTNMADKPEEDQHEISSKGHVLYASFDDDINETSDAIGSRSNSTDRHDTTRVSQKPSSAASESQTRTFYNGLETRNFATFPSLSNQKSQRVFKKSFTRFRSNRGYHRTRGHFQPSKRIVSVDDKLVSEKPISSHIHNPSISEDPANIHKSTKYGIEYFPNSVNTNLKKNQESVRIDKKESIEVEEGYDSDDSDDKVKMFLKTKEEFFSLKSSISPSEVIMNYRHQIQKKSDRCTAQNLSKIEMISSMMKEEGYSVFKYHYDNLMLQQKQFDAFVSCKKHECSVIHDNDVDTIIKRADKIKMLVENECNLFQKTLPAYAYKEKILNSLEDNNVILVSSDSSYFFTTVLPIIFTNELLDYSLTSCESSSLSCDMIKNEIESILKDINNLKIMDENQLLNYLNSKRPTGKNCYIYNLPLKRSVTSDLLLSLLRDHLSDQKHYKLILNISIFDDIKKFQKYFSNLKVFTLEVPKLLLPIQTVWKKEPLSVSKNYKEEIVCTALAIHLLNDPGDVFVFVPSLGDAKIVIAMFNSRIAELKQHNIQCILLHENSCNAVELKNGSSEEKRRFIFISNWAEVMPLPSVKYVIDSGLTRNFIFDSKKKLEALTTVFNSRAKSRLIKSLVGVYHSGICYRIYNKENFCTDMLSYERPEILTLNPFNTLLTMFHYLPEKVLSVQFVEPLNDKLKYNTVKLLKKFNAIKNEKLTELGKKMVKLPFSARYSKLILQSIQWGFAYEAIVLVAFFSIETNLFKYSKNEDYQQTIDAAKLELVQNESDTLTFLYVYKCWLENKCSKAWCDKHYIEYDTLNEVKSKTVEISNIVYERLNENILQEFSEMEDSTSNILEMLFHCFSDNLCVYSGHYRCGYRILTSRQTAFLHPSSVLCNKENMPQLIIYNKIVQTSRDFLCGITAVPSDLVWTSLTDNTIEYDYSDVFERSLVSRVIEPVSERIIKQVLLGKRGKKLQEIEESMKKKLKSELIVVDPSVEKGCVCIYALEPILDSAVKMIEEILQSNLEDVIHAEQVHNLELKRGQVTVPLEVKCMLGAIITSFKIEDFTKSDSSNCSQTSNRKPLKDISSVQYSINLTWIRRPCNGICYVDFTPDSFLQARKLACRSFCVSGSEVYAEVSRKGEFQLILRDVPREARASDIETGILKCMPYVRIEKIELKYVKPFETTLRDIEDLKMQIEDHCEAYTNLKDFDIVVPKPKNASSIMTAYINVFGSEDLTVAAENLSNLLIHDFKVNAIPVYRSVIKSTYKIFSALESRVQKQIEKLKNDLSKAFPKKDLFRFEAEQVSQDLVLIKLLSNDIKIIKLLQKAVHELLEGEVLTKNLVSDIHKLFCHGGHMWLRTLEKSEKVYIIEDYNSKIIRVYGSQKKCFTVKECILKFLEDTESEAVETVLLSNSTNSRILLKSLIKEYGVNLKPFVECCKLRSATLDIKLCRLFLHGSRESIDQAKDILNMLSNNLDSTEEYSLLYGGEMCPVCACPAFNLTFRLQHCGHLYCSECILGLVEQAQFPIQCCAENCSEDIVLDDIARILDEDDEKMKKLLHASLKDFLEKHRSEIFYCPAPDCPMFVYKDQVSERWVCPLCQNEICTNCNVVYHVGFTCDLYQGSKRDPDYSFKVWKKGTSQCKECPNCNTAIEKNEGCDHMTCLSCKAHFCWVCTREFPSAEAVYNHIPFCDKYPKW